MEIISGVRLKSEQLHDTTIVITCVAQLFSYIFIGLWFLPHLQPHCSNPFHKMYRFVVLNDP